MLIASRSSQGRRSGGLRGSSPPWKYVRGVGMFWPPKMSHSFIQNCCWITLKISHHHGWKTFVKNWKVKLIFRGAWNSSMAWPVWPADPLIWRHVYVTGSSIVNVLPSRLHRGCRTDLEARRTWAVLRPGLASWAPWNTEQKDKRTRSLGMNKYIHT